MDELLDERSEQWIQNWYADRLETENAALQDKCAELSVIADALAVENERLRGLLILRGNGGRI